MALGSLKVSLAEQAAGAERDLRLQDVVAGAERVRFGVEEREYSSLLILVQELPDDRPGTERDDDGDTDLPRLESGQEQHDRAAEREQQRGPQIGLAQDQRGGRENHEQRQKISADAADPLERDTVEVAREREDQRDLHKLRRL